MRKGQYFIKFDQRPSELGHPNKREGADQEFPAPYGKMYISQGDPRYSSWVLSKRIQVALPSTSDDRLGVPLEILKKSSIVLLDASKGARDNRSRHS